MSMQGWTQADYALGHLAINLALETIWRTPMHDGDVTYFGRATPHVLERDLLTLRGRFDAEWDAIAKAEQE